MRLPSQLLGLVGLLIGLGLYQLALRLPQPWQSALIGLYFIGLGVAAYRYARGERWIQVLGAALTVFGIIRVFLR